MKTYHSLAELSSSEAPGFGLAMGVFDGVHRGHETVISAARAPGQRTGVLTFEPHPIQVLAPERAPQRILASLAHKERILSRLGVDFLVVRKFTPDFASREARAFAKRLQASGAGRLTAGVDWSFGKDRGGTMDRLAQWCPDLTVVPVPALMHRGERISSTRIRQALRDGNLLAVEEMLGRPYSVFGEVRQGAQLGRSIGVPTANLSVLPQQLPENGVYAVSGSWDHVWHHGVANIGTKPTVTADPLRTLEVHFLEGTPPDTYGWQAEIAFHQRLRNEQKFANLDALKAQITLDIENARTALQVTK